MALLFITTLIASSVSARSLVSLDQLSAAVNAAEANDINTVANENKHSGMDITVWTAKDNACGNNALTTIPDVFYDLNVTGGSDKPFSTIKTQRLLSESESILTFTDEACSILDATITLVDQSKANDYTVFWKGGSTKEVGDGAQCSVLDSPATCFMLLSGETATGA